MELSSVKLYSAFALLLLTLIAITLPLCIFKQPTSLFDPLYRFTTRNNILSVLNCFAGGVFLGTCLLHLFPDVSEQVNVLVEFYKINRNFPVTEFLFGFGFLIILVVEQITQSFKENGNAREISIPQDNVSSNRNLVIDGTPEDSGQHVNYTHRAAQSKEYIDTVPQSFSGSSEEVSLLSGNVPSNRNCVPDEMPEDSGRYVNRAYGTIQGTNELREYNISFPPTQPLYSSFRAKLLLFALSLHSVFEGLAIGLQPTIKDDLHILGAVLFHKCIIAFSMGLNNMQQNIPLYDIVISNVFFSLASPVGIVIGLLVTNLVTGIAMSVTSTILQGLAAGTFLYVTLLEVLPKELLSENDEYRLLKVLFIIIGYSIVSILVLFLPD